jgi:8-oxo-dGTP diphosphatase
LNYIKGVSAALAHQGKILIVRRSINDDFLAGYYEMPGGKIEPGEDEEQALIREIQEEVSLKVKALKKFHVFTYQPGPATHCTDYQYLVAIVGDENISNLKLSDEHDEHKWINEAELNELSPITPEAKESLKLAFKEL